MAGLHLAAHIGPGVTRSDQEIVSAARAGGVDIESVSHCGVDGPGPQGLMFGYGAISLDRIPEGLARLREVV